MTNVSKLDELARTQALRASILHVGGFRPTNNLSASNFGRKPLALPGEGWPVWDGQPLLFVCQLNLGAAPVVPALLRDIRLMTFFVAPSGGPLQEENGKDWCLRTYRSLTDLAPLSPPDTAPRLIRGFECRWEERADSPASGGTKVGGLPTEIQSEPWWELRDHPAQPAFCWQIDSEEKVGLAWGDKGIVYLARGTARGYEDRWFLDWQTY